jgi:hypothetical protein
MASNCYTAGRIEAAVRYADDGSKVVLERGCDVLPYGQEGNIGGAYMYIGHPERWVEHCRAELGRGRTSLAIQVCLVLGLVFAGSGEEARVVADSLIEPAEATRNPFMLSFALFAHAAAFGETDPGRALDAYRRGLSIAQDSGNRFLVSSIAYALGRLEATHGDPVSAFEYLGLAIGNMHDSGDRTTMCIPLAVLATALDRLERYDSAATIAGFAFGPLTEMLYPEMTGAITHLRAVLGDQSYESLAQKGASMTTAAMATYAYDEIDRARAELSSVAK